MSTRPISPSQYPDTTQINLNRLLAKLEHSILSSSANPLLRTSSFERVKVGQNVEYARTLLLNLEHSASTLPSKSKKSVLQADLQQKRELIKQLNQRLYELNQLDDSDSDGSADSGDEDEDVLPSYAPRVKEEAGIEVTAGEGQGNEALANAARSLTNELRSRKGGSATKEDATTSGAALWPSKSNDPAAQTEAALAHDRTEQEALSASLLDMARQLKLQSQQFGDTLEADKGVVNRTVEGLDKNTEHMDAASRRMGTLRRMTEGRGWWDRMKLYAIIFGLWVFAFLLVSMGPKIRF
ncbi:hypothetical protein P154DRAFT_318325 [Amniculicola lignicola CBS 123094]|uniref:Synaptobrevin n=1 Tax=Amniculicola lignicola CBS 123094 TaxID=1392246 RepID=A0A6A5WX93_9PLEO|nr:hypothetical protein P154DRAFT_318325 [Amniculicola lignicola CBS 123094]